LKFTIYFSSQKSKPKRELVHVTIISVKVDAIRSGHTEQGLIHVNRLGKVVRVRVPHAAARHVDPGALLLPDHALHHKLVPVNENNNTLGDIVDLNETY
jgi:hypothetical protein